MHIQMQLMMYIGNDLMEAVPLDREQVPVPGYLGNIKRRLKEKYKDALQNASQPVEFLVVPPVIETAVSE
ncbi:hypothetical protein [Flavisolibacter ginsenosidimutans]|uniref:Uncharacterized protein n=1 Tax=Flavisolibacter ginsenosidimutans TaxID=661481 RepID=A0A5B8UN58_9BACT|nr:hypothetical protein [Flavisolibacter ginsenosidimutans]QEC57649.1 hypothetical protein FSB75_17650 [Flavisolibacter ginsenosidimutans]